MTRRTTRREVIGAAATMAAAALLPASAIANIPPPRLVANMDAFRFNLRAVRGYALELAETYDSEDSGYLQAKRQRLLHAFGPHLDMMQAALRTRNHTEAALTDVEGIFQMAIFLSRRAIAKGLNDKALISFSSALVDQFTLRMMRANAKLDPPDEVTPELFGHAAKQLHRAIRRADRSRTSEA